MKFMNRLFSFFKKEKNHSVFEKYLVARNDYLVLKKTLEYKKRKKLISFKEIEIEEDKIKILLERKWYWEKRLVDVTKGLFLGVGVDLELVKELIPIYLDWKKLVNHYFVYGTSQVGKSRLLATHVRQMILNNWNVLIVDPRGGKGQEI